MIIDPYKSTACASYTNMSKIETELGKAITMNGDSFKNLGGTAECSLMVMLPGGDFNVKPFGHTLKVSLPGGYNALVADGRPMYSYNHDGARQLKPVMMFANQWLETRLRLQGIWESTEIAMLKDISDYPMMVYGKVISEALSRKYGLELEAIARVDLLCAYAFWCFTHTKEEYEAVDIEQIASLISTNIRSTLADVKGVIKEVDYINNVGDLVEALKREDVISSRRLSGISVASLYEVMRARSIWGVDAVAPSTEIICLALEHPPTWYACLFVSLSTTFMKNNIVQVSQRYKRIKDPSSFLMSVSHLIGAN